MTLTALLARRAALKAELADLTRQIRNARERAKRAAWPETKRQASVQRVKAWCRAHPERVRITHRVANRAWYARQKEAAL